MDSVMQRVSSMEEDVRDSTARMSQSISGLKNTKATPVHVSTITFLCETSAHDLDASSVLKKFEEDPTFAQRYKVRGQVVAAKPIGKTVSSKGKVRESFYNQVSLFYKDDASKKNIKVFKNGKLHITGEKDVRENVLIAVDVCRLLEGVFEKPHGSFEVIDFDIQMINTNFRMSHGFILNSFKEAVTKTLPKVPRITYDPETYPGLNMKLRLSDDTQVTLLIFNTGNVIATGLRTFSKLAEAFDVFTRFVDDNIDAFKRQNYVGF
jgi:TATA-box binding protein (TBP) (component of TFIID and TFIIIB)